MTVPPLHIRTDLEQHADWLGVRLDALEARIMARVDDLQTALDTLTASVADYTSDVALTLAELKALLEAALANDTADAAALADTSAQLAAVLEGVDAALVKAQALNAAVAAADGGVDHP